MPRTKASDTVTLTSDQYNELIRRLDELGKGQSDLNKAQQDIRLEFTARKHIDDTVEKDHALLEGNGKPGFVAIRDKVLSWDLKINTVTLLFVGQVVVQLIILAVSKMAN